MGVKPSKSMLKFWDGYDLHPLIEKMDQALQAKGFLFVDQSSDFGLYRWQKSFSHEYLVEAVVSSARRASTPSGVVSIDCWISVRSKKVFDVEREAKLWECEGQVVSLNAPEGNSVTVLVYILDRWLKFAECGDLGGDNYFAQFHSADNIAHQKVCESLLSLMSRLELEVLEEGVLINELLSSPVSLLGIPSIRTKTARLPEYAAISHALLGNRGQAQEILRLAMQEAMNVSDEVDLCRLNKIQKWMSRAEYTNKGPELITKHK